MLKRNSLKKYFTLILMFFTVVIGFSSWIIVGEKNETLGEVAVTTPVAHVLNSSGTKVNDYTRVEAAIEAANKLGSSTIVVRPGANPSISKNCTINSGVTLSIPYSLADDGYTPTANYSEAQIYGSGSFGEKTASNLKSILTIKKDVEIINNGVIEIGGILNGGQATTQACGQTSGFYSKISMETNAKIISNGTIYCYGFIDEVFDSSITETMATEGNGAEIIINSGGYIYQPFIIRDFAGGTNTLSIITSMSPWFGTKYRCPPFNQWEFRNIYCTTRINQGGFYQLWANVQMNSTVYPSKINFIGSTSSDFISINTNGYVKIKYNYITEVCKLSFYKGFTVGNLTLKVGSYEASTKEAAFPLTFRHILYLNDGEYIMTSQRMKIMPGGGIIVNKGATLKGLDFNVYPSTFSGYALNGDRTAYPSGKGEGMLKVGGILTSTNLGGNVYLLNSTASVSATTASSTTYEATGRGNLSMKYDKLNYSLTKITAY